MKHFKTLLFATAMAFAGPAYAGEVVLSVETGMAVMGDSGLSTIGPLERDELATSKVQGVSIGYQWPAYGGRVRGLLGYEALNADGDWGVAADGGVARQTVDINTTGLVLGAEYDIMQVRIGDLYPFVGAGVRLNINRPVHAALITSGEGPTTGCVADDADTWAVGYHGLAGLAYDFAGGWTGRVFYQYTDRGTADMDERSGCPTWKGVNISPGKVRIVDQSIRVRVSYQF